MRWLCGVVLGIVACGHVRAQDIHVPANERVARSSSGVALTYDARLCALSVRALATGQESRHPVPDAGWAIQDSGRPALLLTVLPLRPGKYQVTSLAEADSWDEQHGSGPAFGYTGCRSRSLDNRKAEISFEIKEGEVTLLRVPSGDMEFQDLDVVELALLNQYVQESVADWFPDIRRAAKARHQALVARQREPRDGYDVYRNCDRKTAVVRTSGKPFPFVLDPESELAREEFRGRALAGFRSGRSVHASGFGGACTGGYSFNVYMSDPSELEAAIRELGGWLVKEDLQGEIDISIEGVPVLQ